MDYKRVLATNEYSIGRTGTSARASELRRPSRDRLRCGPDGVPKERTAAVSFRGTPERASVVGYSVQLWSTHRTGSTGLVRVTVATAQAVPQAAPEKYP